MASRYIIPVVQEYEDLKAYLVQEHNAKVGSGGNQTIIRCPWCGDSKDPRNAHLYVGLNKRGDNTIAYYCFLCGKGGIVDNNFFRAIQCYDINLIDEVVTYNNKSDKVRYFDYLNRDNPYKGQYEPIIKNEVERNSAEYAFAKLDYINKRLGVNLNFQDLARLKIVLSINRYLRDNHMRGTGRSREVMENLDKYHIGFLSVDNTYMVERAIRDTSHLSERFKLRYVNYCLYTNRFKTHRFYAIPTSIDTSQPVTIHLAEGPFDVLGIYFNVVGPENAANHIFIASCGKAMFADALKYIFVELLIPYCICSLDFYVDRESDGSINLEEFRGFINSMRELLVDVRVHANMHEGEKDYGVTRDRIIDTIIE